MHATSPSIRFFLASALLGLALTMSGLIIGDALVDHYFPEASPAPALSDAVPAPAIECDDFAGTGTIQCVDGWTGLVVSETPAPVPACAPVGPGSNGLADEVDGQAFLSWRDAVVEDGVLDYDGSGEVGVWSLALWDGGTEVLGYSPAEDAPIFASADCALAFR